MAFPTGTPSYTTPTAGETLAAGQHTALHTQEEADIVALANKVGTGASTPTANQVLTGNGVGTSSWSQVNLTTMVSGILPVANGGTGTTSTTGTGSVVFGTSPTIATPTLTSPTIANFTNANHNHQNATGGGTLGEAAIDWSTFANNIKSALNAGTISPSNGVDNNFASSISISFTVAAACVALVTVSIGTVSTSDFEFQPEIFLDGSKYIGFTPAASAGSAAGRSVVRGFTAAVSLSAGAHTLAPGAFYNSGTALTVVSGSASIAAIVLGNVTA